MSMLFVSATWSRPAGLAAAAAMAMSACLHPPQPVEGAPAASAPTVRLPAASATAPPTEPAPNRCDDAPKLQLRVEDLALTCPDDLRSCSGELSLVVDSCAGHEVRVTTAQLDYGEQTVLTLEFHEALLAPQGHWSHHVPMYREGAVSITLQYVDEVSKRPGTLQARARVTNPKREAAMAACRKCQGIWGTWGMMGWEGCNCRMADAGKACRDGNECTGYCLFESFEVLTPRQPVRCSGGTCSASLGSGVPVGRCSERQRLYGCRAIIRRGASSDPPQTLPGRAPTICID